MNTSSVEHSFKCIGNKVSPTLHLRDQPRKPGLTLPKLSMPKWGIPVWTIPVWISLLCSGCSSLPKAWLDYTDTFLVDGRIVDTGNHRISHSEGQGYGMLLAFYYNDQDRFERIWQWTKQNLQVRDDGLFAWKWSPQQENTPSGIQDINNATDGDLLIGYALTLAGSHWQRFDYLEEAQSISTSVLKHLTVAFDSNNTLLLPAAYGFNKEGAIAFNPSYQITAAYQAFEQLSPPANWKGNRKDEWQKQWQDIHQSSLGVINQHLLPTSELAPDWIALPHATDHQNNKTIENTSPLAASESLTSLWPEKRSYFGDEAIRVYLYQLWQNPKLSPLVEGTVQPSTVESNAVKSTTLPYRADYLLHHFKESGHIPRYVTSNGEASNQEAMAGYYAILAMNAKRLEKTQLANQLLLKAQQKLESEKEDYYSHTLFLLAINADPSRAWRMP